MGYSDLSLMFYGLNKKVDLVLKNSFPQYLLLGVVLLPGKAPFGDPRNLFLKKLSPRLFYSLKINK